MGQKHYGWIHGDTKMESEGQSKPLPGVRHAEDRKDSFVKSMVSRIMKWRNRKKKKPQGMGTVTTDAMKNVKKRNKALEEASK